MMATFTTMGRNIGEERRGERAVALPIAMIVVFLVLFTGLAFVEIARMENVRAVQDTQALEALAAAEFGMERARRMCASQNVPCSLMTYNGQQLYFYPNYDPPYNGNYVCDLFTDEPVNGNPHVTYSVVLEDISTWIPGGGQYRIHAIGTAGQESHRITIEAQSLTYAAFGWLTDSEGGVYFTTGDTVDGWVYTNDHLNIYGSPVFTGRVNSAASYVNYYRGGPPYDNPEFQQGLFLNSTPLDMATLIHSGHVAAVRDRALEDDGIWLEPNSGRPYIVEFNADGTISVQKKRANGEWELVYDHKDLSTTNGAIYVEETVGVKGTVNGQVTLATPENKDIYIIDDLVYAHPPDPADAFEEGFDSSDPAFDDKLGLISGRDIIVKKAWTSDWSDMYVMASLLSVTGSFRNYYYTSYGFKYLHILGGVAQDTRGPVGRTDNRGFLKDYHYDQRFLTEPPPHFPVAMYDFNTWQLDPYQ